MLELIKYIILGIIQGITEIFPVSSSGHLIIFSNLFKTFDPSSANVFLMLTNFGSAIALFYFFRNDAKQLIVSFFSFLFNNEKRNDPVIKNDFNYSLKLIITVIPIGILGLLLESHLPQTMLSVGISLLITATLLLLMFLLRNHQFKKEITWKNAFVIGLFQASAIVPGISRSGITTVGGLSQKIEIKTALKFSFLSYLLISIPVSIKGLIDAINYPETINLLGYILAFIFSFIATFVSTKLLYKYMKVKNLIYFSIYCFLIGSFAIIYYFVI
ncbi:MAG TPA: undecaprenyl-diphosphate phosphatase [Acholeplasmataceae bacterium]|nr:undecaprenyl-diphosphate phosphatase [Acholeplasmataceae bacterium]